MPQNKKWKSRVYRLDTITEEVIPPELYHECNVLLHSLRMVRLLRGEYAEKQWLPMPRVRIEKWVGKDYAGRTLRALLEAEVLYRTGYRLGYCRRYALNPQFKGKWSLYELPAGHLKDRIRALRSKSQVDDKPRDENPATIIGNINRGIRERRATQELIDQINLRGYKFSIAEFDIPLQTSKRDPEEVRNEWRDILNSLRDNDYEMKRDWIGRVHSLFTRLRKDMRPYVYLRKRPSTQLISLDYKSIQPHLLSSATLINQAIFSSLLGQGQTEESSLGDTIPYFTDIPGFGDKRLFEAVHAGTFYEDILHGLGLSLDQRGTIKEEAIKCLFDKGHSRYKIRKRVRAELFNQFPVFMQWLAELKEVLNTEETPTRRKGGYKSVARLCQSLESTIMIKGVAGTIIRDYPREPFFTIHDCLVVRKAFVPVAKGIMETEAAKLGFTPKIKPEPFNNPSLVRETLCRS